MTYDWLSGNVYYVDGFAKQIGVVCTWPGGNFWKPIASGLTDPKGIAIHPMSRCL